MKNPAIIKQLWTLTAFSLLTLHVCAAAALEFAYLPAGLKLPVKLATADGESTSQGIMVQAKVTKKVLLGDNQFIPAGTVVFGYANGKDSPIRFNRLQLSNGKTIPISARILPADNNEDNLTIELQAPAQIAVEGGIL